MGQYTEYQVNGRHPWVRPLGEAEDEEEQSADSENPNGKSLELEGYRIISDKKIALLPVDLLPTKSGA